MTIDRPRIVRPNRLWVGATTVVIAFAVSGCSEGDGRLSRAEFLEQGNAICLAGNARIATLQPPGPPDQLPSGADGQAYFGQAMEIVQDQIDELRALKPPAELDADITRLLADGQKTLDEVKTKGPEIFADGDPFASVNAEFTKLGLTVCGSSE